jgi:hypothetical protein
LGRGIWQIGLNGQYEDADGILDQAIKKEVQITVD